MLYDWRSLQLMRFRPCDAVVLSDLRVWGHSDATENCRPNIQLATRIFKVYGQEIFPTLGSGEHSRYTLGETGVQAGSRIFGSNNQDHRANGRQRRKNTRHNLVASLE